MCIRDRYNCTGIQNGRLIYNRTNTKNRRQDKAKLDIRIEPEALALIEKYREPTGVRLFEFHRKYANSDIFNAQVNKVLKPVSYTHLMCIRDRSASARTAPYPPH